MIKFFSLIGDSMLDTVKLLPFLFLTYMLMEYPNTFAAAVMGSGASGLSYYTNLENIAKLKNLIF